MRKYRKMFSITMGLCRADLYMPTHVFETKKVIGKGHNSIIFKVENNTNTGYFNDYIITEIGNEGIKILSSTEFVENNKKQVSVVCNDLWDYAEMINSLQIKYISDNELLEYYNTLFEKIQTVFGYFNVSQPCISFALENKIKELLEQAKIDRDVQLDITREMLKQDEITHMEQEEIELIEFAIKIKKKGIENNFNGSFIGIVKNINWDIPEFFNHQRKYAFLASSENFDEFDLKYFAERLQKLLGLSESELCKRIIEKNPDKEVLSKKREMCIKKHKLSSELVYFFNVARIYSHQRMLTRIFWTKGINVWGKMLREIARRMNLNETEIQYILRKEINQYFDNKNIISEEEVRKRMKFCIYAIFNESEPMLFTGDTAREIEEKYLNDQIKNNQEVRGITANKGKVRGRVKLLAYGKNMILQINEMKKGDILVTGNTRPDMMLAIEKAIAIVTDEGGICSHAAIVSRELNIPCIIGTKDATRIFKDGDIIEVDADNGIVRKINSSENKNN